MPDIDMNNYGYIWNTLSQRWLEQNDSNSQSLSGSH